MEIDWAHFTPWGSLGGGVLIGLAAAVLWLSIRRTAGISGIFGETLAGRGFDSGAWRLAFLSGMLVAPWLGVDGDPEHGRFDVPMSVFITAGLLTGLGTRLARGCTSGHGVCGLSRLSPRSAVAVVSFMGAGMLMVMTLRLFVGSAP